MHILKTILRWILIALCLTAMLAYGLFSVSGLTGLGIAVLALPIAPSRFLWKLILPSDSPRFAKEAILAAAFLLLLAASPAAVEQGATPEKNAPRGNGCPQSGAGIRKFFCLRRSAGNIRCAAAICNTVPFIGTCGGGRR